MYNHALFSVCAERVSLGSLESVLPPPPHLCTCRLHLPLNHYLQTQPELRSVLSNSTTPNWSICIFSCFPVFSTLFGCRKIHGLFANVPNERLVNQTLKWQSKINVEDSDIRQKPSCPNKALMSSQPFNLGGAAPPLGLRSFSWKEPTGHLQ